MAKKNKETRYGELKERLFDADGNVQPGIKQSELEEFYQLEDALVEKETGSDPERVAEILAESKAQDEKVEKEKREWTEKTEILTELYEIVDELRGLITDLQRRVFALEKSGKLTPPDQEYEVPDTVTIRPSSKMITLNVNGSPVSVPYYGPPAKRKAE